MTETTIHLKLMRWIRAGITYGLFPVWLTAALVAGVWCHTAGVIPEIILVSVGVITAAVVAIAERIQPAHSQWNQSHGDLGTDSVHVVVSQAIVPALMESLITAAILHLSISATAWVGQSVWPHSWPLVFQLALALVTAQFFEYWFHRLSHTHPLLWRVHATHHCAQRLYFLNAGRFHPIDTAALSFLSFGSLMFLGVGEEVMLLMACWITVHGLFQHCNILLRLGPLNWIFSMAELHRWHHSQVLEEANSNYGNNILFWDIVFDTVYWPREKDAGAEIGIGDMPNFPQTWWGQIRSPFRWNEISKG
jgi:sterol desaturase/sphingolipid hydroxylase (fatty acid hydroxylase superfamily)